MLTKLYREKVNAIFTSQAGTKRTAAGHAYVHLPASPKLGVSRISGNFRRQISERKPPMMQRRSFLLTSFFALGGGTATAADPWEALRSSDAFVLLRHATAPGTGDPPGMRIGACDTQRNLSAEGQAQAKRIGQLFRENGLRQASVFSSQWCRCLDTAALLDLGPVSEQTLLNSFFDAPETGREQTEGLRAWLKHSQSSAPRVLVTHQVNITGLTSVVPRSGELVFAMIGRDGAVSVIARLSAGV